MNKEELLKQIEETKNHIDKLQSAIEKMQNAVDKIKDKDNNSLPEFWLPEEYEPYYFIDIGDFGPGEPLATEWEDDPVDFLNRMLNNVFRTKEECEIEAEVLNLFAEIKEKALQEGELVPKDKVLDIDTYKYVIDYDCSEYRLCSFGFSVVYHQGIIPNCFFKTSEFAEEIINEYGERIKAVLNKKYGGNNEFGFK